MLLLILPKKKKYLETLNYLSDLIHFIWRSSVRRSVYLGCFRCTLRSSPRGRAPRKLLKEECGFSSKTLRPRLKHQRAPTRLSTRRSPGPKPDLRPGCGPTAPNSRAPRRDQGTRRAPRLPTPRPLPRAPWSREVRNHDTTSCFGGPRGSACISADHVFSRGADGSCPPPTLPRGLGPSHC